MDRMMHKTKENNAKLITTWIFGIILFLLVPLLFISEQAIAATPSVTVKEINYENSTITLTVNSADTEIYFSDSTKKTWELISDDISSNNTITMDISWVSLSKNYVLTFKGDYSTGITSVTIPKQVTNFKAAYNKSKGAVTFSKAGARTIQWRKKASTTWNTVNTDTISTELSYLYTNGASVYFRLAPVNGTSSKSVGYRASKEVLVAISKKATAPVITVDGSDFTVSVKKGIAYRQINSDSTTTSWTTLSSKTDLLLTNIASSAMYTSSSTVQKEVNLQFRTNATSSAQVSNLSNVTIPVQEGPPSADTSGISLTYTSSTTLALQVKAASTTVPFEYTIIDLEDDLNYLTAKWTSISSSSKIVIDDDTAETGSHIYIRKKSVGTTGDDDFALASKEIDISGTNGIAYPDAAQASTLTTLISTSGVCNLSDSSSYLTFTLYNPTSTTVSSIEFLDAYGIAQGTVTCKSTVATNSNSTSSADKYIITTKITSTSNIDSVTEELLYADITFANSDVITSTASTGIRLYLYPSTTVNNTENDDYTNNFERVHLSTDADDDTSFTFQLDLGTKYVFNPSAVNTFTTEATAINSIVYDDYTLVKGTDYTVVYGSYVKDDETIATATVTVKVSSFEGSSSIDIANIAEPLTITLNNDEILDDEVYLTLRSTATLNNTPMAWSITEGSLLETTTSTTTNEDDSTTTVTEEVVTFSLSLSLFDTSYAVGISDVTWGGISVFGSAELSKGTATIYLSNKKINKLSTTTTQTENIVITFSNGFSITKGCKLTILNKSE
ncbi:MAG: hypothetical protein WBI07_14005 [Mobilitalea sp.]